MPYVDLSHPLENDMTVFPGTPPVDFSSLSTIEADGWAIRHLRFSSHVGTHLDTPAHNIADGATLDDFPLEHFVGPAVMVDVRPSIPSSTNPSQTARTENPPISEASLRLHGAALADAAFVLLHTGWSARWKTPAYLQGFPVLTPNAARYLTTLPKLRGVGVDAISPDPTDSQECPIHKILLGAELLILENLRGLNQLPNTGTGRGFEFLCLPLRIPQGDGSPVRAVARLD